MLERGSRRRVYSGGRQTIERIEIMAAGFHLSRSLVPITFVLMAVPALAAGPTAVRIIQTNAAGDDVHSSIRSTNKVVGMIYDIEVAHGVISSPDGTPIYFTDESLRTVDAVDAKTLKMISRFRSADTRTICGHQRRQAGLRRHRAGAGRGRRHRHRHPDQHQDDSGRRRGAQRLRHARRQVRGLRLSGRPASSRRSTPRPKRSPGR